MTRVMTSSPTSGYLLRCKENYGPLNDFDWLVADLHLMILFEQGGIWIFGGVKTISITMHPEIFLPNTFNNPARDNVVKWDKAALGNRRSLIPFHSFKLCLTASAIFYFGMFFSSFSR